MTIARRGLAALAITLALSGSAFAQAWPNKPIRWIVPYTPGGYTDLMSRTVGQKVSDALGSADHLREPPGRQRHHRHRRGREGGARRLHLRHRDRRTCGQRHAQSEAALRHDEGLHLRVADERRAADHHRATTSLPANNIKELIALAKAKPGELEFRLFGRRRRRASHHGDVQGAHGHRHAARPLQGHRGRAAGHGRRTHQRDVRHRRTADAAGEGRQRQGAWASPRRSRSRPRRACRRSSSRACRISSPAPGPASSRRPARRRRSSIASPPRPRRRCADPAMKAKLAEQGIVAVGNTPDEYRAFVAEEIARWAKVIKDANIKMR